MFQLWYLLLMLSHVSAPAHWLTQHAANELSAGHSWFSTSEWTSGFVQTDLRRSHWAVCCWTLVLSVHTRSLWTEHSNHFSVLNEMFCFCRRSIWTSTWLLCVFGVVSARWPFVTHGRQLSLWSALLISTLTGVSVCY